MISTRISKQIHLESRADRRSATLHLVQSSRIAKRLSKLLLVGLFVSIAAMGFLPWQQTSRGTGDVVAYYPQERQQTVQAQTKGVVKRIADGLVEGGKVKKGDFLIEIQPFASDMIEQLRGQVRDLEMKQQAAQFKVDAQKRVVQSMSESVAFSVTAAGDMVLMTEAKLESKQKQIPGYESKVWQAQQNYDRQKLLSEKNLKPAKEVEKLLKELNVAKAEYQSILKDIEALNRELSAKKSELEEKRSFADAKVSYEQGMLQSAKGSLATIQKEIRDLQIKQQEAERFEIYAPRDGTIFRLQVNERGDSVKPGDPLLTIVPEVTTKAVELYINGNDMPLVQIDQEVRLQFEGWPAVQFAGWPSVAVGTFSGKVASVDPTDNNKGEFRILVVQNELDQAWPSDRYLRQGVRANGWVMLRRVSLGYEIWRQLNGFPVIVSDQEPGKEQSKVPKLPK